MDPLRDGQAHGKAVVLGGKQRVCGRGKRGHRPTRQGEKRREHGQRDSGTCGLKAEAAIAHETQDEDAGDSGQKQSCSASWNGCFLALLGVSVNSFELHQQDREKQPHRTLLSSSLLRLLPRPPRLKAVEGALDRFQAQTGTRGSRAGSHGRRRGAAARATAAPGAPRGPLPPARGA